MVRDRIVIMICAVLALAGILRADMMPVNGPQAVCRPAVHSDPAVDEPTGAVALADVSGVADLGSLPFGFLPQTKANPEPAVEAESCPILTDGADSFSLCLYALMGLGVCRSAPWVKRLHLGHIPDWYHHGGPYQIGGSHAISPDCLGSHLICFIQPDMPEHSESNHHQGTFAPLLRKSLCKPTILASRGPPSEPHESFIA